jgi:putative ABC transport system permease protein
VDRPSALPSPHRRWLRRRRFAFGLDLGREIDREIAAHLEHATEELIASGLDAEAAREEAGRRFGDLERYRDACCAIDRRRESLRLRARLWGDLRQDLRLALRTLRRDPAFLAAAMLILTLGLGANVAVFSVVYGVLLKPLPFPHPDRLLMLWEKNPEKGWTAAEVAPANFLDWRRPNPAFADITAYENGTDLLAWTGGGEPRALRASRVAGNFNDVLGVQPARGRALRWEETWRGHRVALVSDAFWRHHLGADPAVVGRTLRLNDVAVTVIGVMPPGFAFPVSDLDLWLPLGWSPDSTGKVWFRRAHMLRAVGRLRPGVSLPQGRGYLAAIAGRLERLYPETNRRMGAGATPLAEWWVGERRPTLLLLAGAVGLVLLIACVNVANLQLVRATARLREMGLRQALGASRWRLARQLLAESLLLAVVAGTAGVAAGAGATRALVALAPDSLPRVTEIGLHPAVLAFALGATLATAMLFGLAPALAVSRPRRESLGHDSRASVPRTALRSREALVVAEVALATLLVAGAGLLLRSFERMRHVDPGFRADHVLAVELSLPGKRYSEDPQVTGFYHRLLAGAAALPGVAGAALADGLPPTGRGWTGDFAIAGRPPGEYGSEFHHRLVSPDYFGVLRVPLRRGRLFRAADGAHSPRVALINERLARQYFGAADPLGQRLTLDRQPTAESVWRTVVGVVGDERLSGVAARAPAQIFEPFAQSPEQSMYLVLRTPGDPLALAQPVRALLRALDRDLPLLSVHSLDEIVAGTLAAERFLTLLMLAFAASALLLAAVGIGSVMSYNIAYRTRELGIRIALGAAAGEILRQSVVRSLLRAALGVACGAAATLAVSPLLAHLLYSTSVTDPATLGAVVLSLLAVACLAAYLPARRTLHIDPAACLRHE